MSTLGRCTTCRRKHKLTAGGRLQSHRGRDGDRCAGVGSEPLDPATDTTPDRRDLQTYWDAVRQLERLRTKDFLTVKDRADIVRLRRIRDESAAGSDRVPLGGKR